MDFILFRSLIKIHLVIKFWIKLYLIFRRKYRRRGNWIHKRKPKQKETWERTFIYHKPIACGFLERDTNITKCGWSSTVLSYCLFFTTNITNTFSSIILVWIAILNEGSLTFGMRMVFFIVQINIFEPVHKLYNWFQKFLNSFNGLLRQGFLCYNVSQLIYLLGNILHKHCCHPNYFQKLSSLHRCLI